MAQHRAVHRGSFRRGRGRAEQPESFLFGRRPRRDLEEHELRTSWVNISDGKIPGVADPIGALAVAPSNAKVIYAGTGEADIRSDFDTGDGVYRTTDAGKTWSYAGLRESAHDRPNSRSTRATPTSCTQRRWGMFLNLTRFAASSKRTMAVKRGATSSSSTTRPAESTL